MTTTTLFSWLALLLAAALVLLPSLVGHLRERRIDRQLREAERGHRPSAPARAAAPAPGQAAAPAPTSARAADRPRGWDPGATRHEAPVRETAVRETAARP
ncbi:hypothetical protein [Streptomyces yaizuensis]|uniref:Uncharacterized protein n=1 Tax=Streptomyces yaizuensis TaxID=2989713 RepID=A0ABQ5NYD9_9ACTN|nr:hypothetical protein [Streptomyces sp. YSPA8]GLF94971.1 hypothetical protein SYYSPA8_11760 [Streptomyces sp. YSPA8]